MKHSRPGFKGPIVFTTDLLQKPPPGVLVAGTMPLQPASSHSALRSLVARWQGHLLARNLSPHTVDGYLRGVRQFINFLEAAGSPTNPVSIRRSHVEGFIADVLAHKSDSTARTRYRDLSVFFNWLIEEGAVESSPMTHVKRPRAQEKQIPIIPEQDLRRLLLTCSGPGFRDRRDKAILLFFLDTGARLSEVADLLVADIELKRRTVTVRGKGRRQRKLPLSPRVGQAMVDYREARSGQAAAGDVWWWLGPKGRFTPSGIRQMCWRRSAEPGIALVHPYMFRHTFSHMFLAAGGNEGDLMRLA